MNHIEKLINIGACYACDMFDIFDDQYHLDTSNEVFQTNQYDSHYKVCNDLAINFINTSNIFSDLTPKEIIKAFANIEFKDNVVLSKKSTRKDYEFGIQDAPGICLELFSICMEINKEMAVALIRAINAGDIKYDELPSFYDYRYKTLGKRDHIFYTDDKMIKLYKKLLKYNDFNIENLNLTDEVKNRIKQTDTKGANFFIKC